MDFRETHSELDRLLHTAAPLWRPAVFNKPSAPWLADIPKLTAKLLSLDDDTLALWQADDHALLRSVAEHYPPALELLDILRCLPESPATLEPLPDRWSWHMPGRKWQQIRYFAEQLAPVKHPLMEWCSGKAHLSRLLSRQWKQASVALERDRQLIDSGRVLSDQDKLPVELQCCDVLADDTDAYFDQHRHGLALHACGELHRHFLRQTVQCQPARVSLAPCCYNLGGPEQWQPLSQFAQNSRLQLRQEELKLAVRQTVTADTREQKRHHQKQQWRLGFNAFWREETGDELPPQLNMQNARRAKSFEAFATALILEANKAESNRSESEHAPSAPDSWEPWRSKGEALYRRVQRLELVSMMYRRPLELWLVLDYAIALEEVGYRVSLSQFCPTKITPRNLMLDARR